MAEIRQTDRVARIIHTAIESCEKDRCAFFTPEHLLLAMTRDKNFAQTLNVFYDLDKFSDSLLHHITKQEHVQEGLDYQPEASMQFEQVIEHACQQVLNSSAEALDLPHLVMGILCLKESWACYLLKEALGDRESHFLSQLISDCEFQDHLENVAGKREPEAAWRQLVTCMNDHYMQHHPLIGREQELRRTIQVLCRRDKNNPLHVGEPGVGKTALVWGLARLIEEGKVPQRLKGSKIYQLDMGTLLAGTQYRGDFENRIKQIMDGIQAESGNNIVYIDEIHTLVGAGATGDSAMDASNMLKPYLESGAIRFIGTTTYQEYNRHFSRSRGLIRRFQQIDIMEPTPDEAKHILQQLQPLYEQFHQVKYDDEAIAFSVEASAKYINDRYLPDKAIDLIDEAGAAMDDGSALVTKSHIADVLAKTCKVEALAIAQDDDYEQLESLAPRMLSQIYGQDEAIRQVVEAVQMSRAGLLDDNKPQASLLFVGPTGVGKTEVARVLANELGIELIRFDMSEYAEKHAVAKLIGSPAGYVGYEDGGLLTDAIRKTPNCVLLLDEIEKAHQDIYNVLLQVMDYARLTDNKGHKADFRNVILIMTSNAGAQFASQGSIGFNGNVSRGEAMMKQVKKTFKPEFLNRLSGTVVFRDMDRDMATLILEKKLRELDARLWGRNVSCDISPEAFEHLLKEAFTAEYGAREMDRVIARQLKPLLMREILFGSLKNGGSVTIGMANGRFLVINDSVL